MDYKTVFEVTEKGFHFIFMIPILLFFFGIVGCWAVFKNKGTIAQKIFMIFYTGFALLMVSILPLAIMERMEINDMYRKKEYKVVEGVIENFIPINGGESFTVNSIFFKYSDNIIQYAYHTTASYGGVLTSNGQQVRLSYITVYKENRILKIELKE